VGPVVIRGGVLPVWGSRKGNGEGRGRDDNAVGLRLSGLQLLS
jgi:hypothetical protein